LADEVVIPMFWAEDGFSSPPQVMVDKIKTGFFVPDLLSTLFTVVCLVIGGLMVIVTGIFFAAKSKFCQNLS
jgi:hypothetical protein